MTRQPEVCTRKEILAGRIAVSFVQYMQKVLLYKDVDPNDVLVYSDNRMALSDRRVFSPKAFREHSENVKTLVKRSLDGYSDDLCEYLIENMLQAGHLNETRDGLIPAIPKDEFKRRRWLRAILARWVTPRLTD